MTWIKSDEPQEAYVWRADERTATLAEHHTAIMVDKVTGTVHLTYLAPSGEAMMAVYPPAVARTIGTALIEAGVLGSGPR
jgi:hypothetical protein